MEPKPIVIGFLGRAGAGKSTATAHVCEQRAAFSATRCAFAKPLKELAKILWDFSDAQVYGTQAEKETVDPRWGITPRTAMIRLGDGGRNTLGKDIWIDACFNKILEHYEAEMARPIADNALRVYSIYVIEDVRYENEVEAIRGDTRFDGFVVKLVCPDSDSSSAYANAPSEKSVDAIPEYLMEAVIKSMKSPGSLDLKSKVDDVVWGIIDKINKRSEALYTE